MEPMIHQGKTGYAAVVILLLTLGLPSRICNPLESSNDSDSYTTKTNLNFTECTSTSCTTAVPNLNAKLGEDISAIGNYFPDNSLLNETRVDTILDVKTSEFALLHNLIRGIINRFTETPTATRTSTITEPPLTFMTATEKNKPDENSSTKIPPALSKNLKSFVPPFLSHLVGRLTETFDRDLLKKENDTSAENIGILESFRQTVLGMAPDRPSNEPSSTSDANLTSSELKKELDEIMIKLKQQVGNPAVKGSKIDQICEIFAEHLKSRIQSYASSSPQNNRIVAALQTTSKVVCSEGNKKLLRELANSQSIWSNRITKRVLRNAIERISKGKTMLRFVLNLIMGTIVEPPHRF